MGSALIAPVQHSMHTRMVCMMARMADPMTASLKAWEAMLEVGEGFMGILKVEFWYGGHESDHQEVLIYSKCFSQSCAREVQIRTFGLLRLLTIS